MVLHLYLTAPFQTSHIPDAYIKTVDHINRNLLKVFRQSEINWHMCLRIMRHIHWNVSYEDAG